MNMLTKWWHLDPISLKSKLTSSNFIHKRDPDDKRDDDRLQQSVFLRNHGSALDFVQIRLGHIRESECYLRFGHRKPDFTQRSDSLPIFRLTAVSNDRIHQHSLARCGPGGWHLAWSALPKPGTKVSGTIRPDLSSQRCCRDSRSSQPFRER
jgi:hypothetical protein